MKKLRNLTVLFLFVLAAMSFNPVAIQADDEPEAPGPECSWSYGAGGYNGTWTCPWGCYHYFYERGKWVHTGTGCGPLYD